MKFVVRNLSLRLPRTIPIVLTESYNQPSGPIAYVPQSTFVSIPTYNRWLVK